MEQNTQEWNEYQKGLDYKRKLNLHATVDKNERFYAGDQWNGVRSNGLPTPVLNIIKRVIQYKISQIMSNQIKMQFSVDGADDIPQQQKNMGNITDNDLLNYAGDLFSGYALKMWERLKFDSINESGLKDCALSGDYVLYHYWDDSVEAGNEVMGDISIEIIDSVNYFPGNPNDTRINYNGKPIQPYIILAYRKLVSDLRDEARLNGMPEEDIMKISGDSDYTEQAGDMAKIELEESQKAICLLKLWKNPDTGTIWAKKSVKQTIIKPDYDTGRKLYPVALMNWEERKNSCHGQAEVTGLIPNQIAINKIAAMLIMSVMHTAFPKMVYDKTRIPKPSNVIGEAIAVEGGTGNVRDLISYMGPGNTAPEAYKLLDTIISYTKEMMGANEVALGEVKPENTSAFIAVNQAVSVPLESVKRRFYQFIEDCGHIWMDFWLTNYNVVRNLPVVQNGMTYNVPINLSTLKGLPFRLKIDIGPSTQWSELASMQTLDSLLNGKHITIDQYLDRVPNGIIPKRQELIDEIRQQMAAYQQQQAEIAQQALLQGGVKNEM